MPETKSPLLLKFWP